MTRKYNFICITYFCVAVHGFIVTILGLDLRRTSIQLSSNNIVQEISKIGSKVLQVNFGKKLGSGSYGDVYAGLLGSTEIVVKTVPKDADCAALEYLEIESYCNQKLKNTLAKYKENYNALFPQYLGKCVDLKGTTFLVWAKCGDGTTLQTLLRNDILESSLIAIGLGSDSTNMLIELLKSLLKMVKACHLSGLCHRDIKPENILLDMDGKSLKLIDFGSAADMKSFFKKGYNFQKSPCSPHYCAPEKFISETYPWKFDIFSVGMIWLRCIFPNLHKDENWNRFHDELVSLDYNIDMWLNRNLLSDVLDEKILVGLTFFNKDGGRGWRLLQKMLVKDPKNRISLNSILSDPYLLGGGQIVSQKSSCSKTFFETIIKENIDICYVEEQPLSIKVSLEKPMGIELEEVPDLDQVRIATIYKGGTADQCDLIHKGDILQMVGGRLCASMSFEDTLCLIKTYPEKKVPLVFGRTSLESVSSNIILRSTTKVHVIDVGGYSMQGSRSYMEDAFCICSLSVTANLEEDAIPSRAIFGAVFDGHRGTSACDFASTEFPKFLRETMSKRHLIPDREILLESWTQLERGYLRSGMQSGCAVASFLVADDDVYFLHCGDSRVLLCGMKNSCTDDGDSIIFATKDHMANDIEEQERIKHFGGEVECSAVGRVRVRVRANKKDTWLLGLSRCLGGSEWRNGGVISAPDISSFRLADNYTHIIAASDGIFEIFDNERCSKLVKCWRNEGKSASETAMMLCKAAFNEGSIDNLSSVVLFLGPA